MKILKALFGRRMASPGGASSGMLPGTGDQYITQRSSGANLVDGAPTWAHAEREKDNFEVMLRCCEAELAAMETADVVAAPFYFERVAILSRKDRNYAAEVDICERYISAVEQYYGGTSRRPGVDIRSGPRYKAIRARLLKARQLLRRSKQLPSA